MTAEPPNEPQPEDRVTITGLMLTLARDAYRRHISRIHEISHRDWAIIPYHQRDLIRELQKIGFLAIEASAFMDSGGTADAAEIARLVGEMSGKVAETPHEEVMVIPVGLLEAITERLDALEKRVALLEESFRPVSRPPRTPPQPTIVVTYPEDLED